MIQIINCRKGALFMKNEELAKLYTASGEALSGQPWSLYPRPQLRRSAFLCLNGEWSFFESEGAEEERILVPFPPESLLSRIGRRLGEDSSPIYHKSFSLPSDFCDKLSENYRVLLHFGAVDQHAEVILNGKRVGKHSGGYDSFFFDITEALNEFQSPNDTANTAENILQVNVTDRLSDKSMPYGKQREKRGGMWYTPVTGIWQTVWLEYVPRKHVSSLRIDTSEKHAELTLFDIYGNPFLDGHGSLTLSLPDGKAAEFPIKNGYARIDVPSPLLWSPESPYLYHFTAKVGDDEFSSYFALRTLEIRKIGRFQRLCLNGKPYFFHGVLDQGYFSDGLFLPASPDGYTNDITAMKALGFNTLRKHIKVEPLHFYYECDRLGMIVFQDMVNNGSYSFIRDTALPTVGFKRRSDKRLNPDARSRAEFRRGMFETVRALRNHPCVCLWTVFNEGWGQFEGQKNYAYLRSLDSSRFIDTTSGWFFGAESDVDSQHVYFKPIKLKASDKPLMLSEFGGYSISVKDHSFNPSKTYGYKKFNELPQLEKAICDLYVNEILPAVPKGLCAAIYTQLSDVEDETNGLLTYDRKVMKVTENAMRHIARLLTERIT